MSRVGKKLIIIPQAVEIKKEGDDLVVRGPLGTLRRSFKKDINIAITDKEIRLSIQEGADLETRILWGSYASHIRNMIEGVTKGYEKKLLIEGAGYKAQVKEEGLVLNIGFSHPVIFKLPEGVAVKVEKNMITMSGADKEKVSLTASRIRALKKAEPYKGKGIRYEKEVIRRKAGKKAISATA